MLGRWSRAALAALAAGTLALAAIDAAGAQGGGLRLQRLGSFEAPVYVTAAPGHKRLLFVVEQPGTVRVIRGDRVLGRPFIDLRDRVRYGGEQGLLSLAFDPRYRSSRRFFVYYVYRVGDIRVDALRT